MEIISDQISTFGIILILSIGLFGAFRTKQNLDRISNNLDACNEFTLKKLKLKTKYLLKKLISEYQEQNSNVNFPENIDYNDIVEKLITMDDSIQGQIVGLYEIYSNLINLTIESPYFTHIIQSLVG